ncbi:hypothetical protein BBJ28_00012464 [Nothophytophthora sp. Chile5]|nr:hypothetical protein BBJ28_00012464 [Nothophytophthora sp. Chile5]
MLESNNVDSGPATGGSEAAEPDAWVREAMQGLLLSSADPLAVEMAAMLRPKMSAPPSIEDEDEELPMLESNRPSSAVGDAFSTSKMEEHVISTAQVPEGELHVWVFEARQLSADAWPLTEAMYDRHGLRVRCSLLGAVQESPSNISGSRSHPIWRQEADAARDGTRGHFAWALGHRDGSLTPEGGANIGVEASECKLEIELVCGVRVIGSASVALEDLLLSSKTDEEDTQIVRLSPHWLPLAGPDAGLLEMALEFLPVTPASNQQQAGDNSSEEPASEPTDGFYAQMKAQNRQRKTRFEPRELVEACEAHPWRDQRRHDDSEVSETSSSQVIVSRSEGVTMYIPTSAGEAPASLKAEKPSEKPSSSFGLRPGGEQERLMDKQLWDLYYFGISSESPEASGDANTDLSDKTRALSAASDYSTNFSDLSSRSNASAFSREASTCASDVLAYNELIQDMESALIAAEEPSNQEAKAEPESKSPVSSPPKMQLKLRPKRRATLGFKPSLDRLQSFWSEAKARRSNDSENSTTGPPVATRPRQKPSWSPSKSEGVVLFDPQTLPSRFPADKATSEIKLEVKPDAAGPRRRSLPINSLFSQQRTQLLAQKQAAAQVEEAQPTPPLLASVEPPLLSRTRSSSLHSLTDLYLPSAGDAHALPISAGPSASASTYAARGGSSRATVRRHSGSNVVYINGQPLCVGKFISVGSVPGVVRYIGTTRFATGTWVGIELCEDKGKNSGAVAGQRYFSCAPDHGIFIRASRLDLSLQ